MNFFSKLILLIVAFPICGWTQDANNVRAIDSLKNLIETTTDDSIKFSAYHNWDSRIYYTDPALDLELNQKMLELIDANSGNYHRFGRHYEHYQAVIAELHNNIGLVLLDYYAAYEEAMEHLQKSHFIAFQMQDSVMLSMSINNMGLIAQIQGDWEKALDYYEQSKNLEGDDPESNAISYNNIGVCYNELGRRDLALENYNIAYGLAESIDYKYQMSNTLGNIGVTHYNLGNFDLAISYLTRSDSIARSENFIKVVSFNQYMLGLCYIKLSRYDNAIQRCQEGLEIAEADSILHEQYLNCECLYKAHKGKNQPSVALKYHELYHTYKDSMINEEQSEALRKSEQNYSYKKKSFTDSLNFVHQGEIIRNQHKSEISKANLRLYILITILSGVILIAFIFFRAYSIKKRDNKKIADARRKIEEEKQNKELFIAKTSHDIRSPLHSITGNLELMLAKSKENNRLAKNAFESGQYMLAVIDDILDISKLESGEMQLNLTDFDLRQECKKLINALLPNANEKKLDLDLNISSEVPIFIRSDKLRFGQMINNLLTNSLKFTSEGHIELKVTYSNEQLTLCVSDTGMGISEDNLKHILEEYRQVDTGKSRNGSGLGLAIVKGIVTLMQGELKIQSEVGKGSSFEIKIPIQKGISDSSPKSNSLVDLNKKGVLIIDDSTFSAETTAAMIHHLNGKPLTATDDSQISELLKANDIHTVLIDLNLGSSSGFDVAKRIKHEQLPDSKLVAISGFLNSDRIDRAKKAGMSYALSKPFNLQELSDCFKYVDESLAPMQKDVGENNIEEINRENFITEVPAIIENLNRSLEMDNDKDLKFYIHKVKPCYFYIGEHEIFDKIVEFEQQFESKSREEITLFVTELNTSTEKIIAKL